MQATIEDRRARDYERFEANRRFEEMTDIAERIGYPIDVTIGYELRGEALYARTDTVSRPFHNQTYQALLAGQDTFNGDQSFERTRLAHEHTEALLADKLAKGELAGNVMIKLSKVPDAVVEGRTSIKGYRRDLLRSFVRIYHRTPDGVECRLFTLDHNNEAGMCRVGQILGIDTQRSSEDILADYALLSVPTDTDTFVDELVSATIHAYDTQVYAQNGRETYAGSFYTSKQDAMSVIEKQPHLLGQHMTAIASIMAAGLGERRLEDERERTAAAIKLAHEGYMVSSNSDASVSTEVEAGNYGGECATASQNGMNQAGMVENIWSKGECQVCFVQTMVGSCKVCAGCAAADDRGEDLLKLRARNIRRRENLRQNKLIPEYTPQKLKQPHSKNVKIDNVCAQYGAYAVLKKEVAICGVREVVLDRRTNAVLSVS